MYVQKAEKRGGTQAEVDRVICWLTGDTQAGLEMQLKQGVDFETFFAQAPALNPNAQLVKGIVCGVRVEQVPDPLMKKIRVLDKIVDELVVAAGLLLFGAGMAGAGDAPYPRDSSEGGRRRDGIRDAGRHLGRTADSQSATAAR